MFVDVSQVVLLLLADNLGPDPSNPDVRRQPEYGVTATLEENSLSVILTFRHDKAYCCYEWGCHLCLYDSERWQRLRQSFSAFGIAVPELLKLDLTCVIEEGARFFDLSRPDPKRRGWFEFEPMAASSYKVSAVEGACISTA